MTEVLLNGCAGFFTGGLALSAAWGLFWLTISLVGLSRRTCGWRMVFMSVVGGLVPLALAIALVWWVGGLERMTPVFAVGLLGMPTVLAGLWLRRMPDGQRAGTHLAAGARHLMEELLGAHRGCGGCQDGHDHETYR
ncbi:MAG: hypothetical protein A4E19_15075 [Nitrospira sp. SG-bin1]|nr:MAG: hypothetical protein A4E19_15075 [Nitrospira sp. SG-bin1]